MGTGRTTSNKRGRVPFESHWPLQGSPRTNLSITIESNQLVVRGKQDAGDGERVFLHSRHCGPTVSVFIRFSRRYRSRWRLSGAAPIAHRYGTPPGRSIGSLGQDHNRTGQNARRSHRGTRSSLETCGSLATRGPSQHPLRALSPTAFATLGAVRRCNLRRPARDPYQSSFEPSIPPAPRIPPTTHEVSAVARIAGRTRL
jgi:hypothetical protein